MVRFQDHSKSSAVTGSPFVHFPSLRRWKVTVLPSLLTSQLSAKPGTGSRSSPSRTRGSMMLRRMLDEVTSVASPGSSEGGSAPQPIVIVCFDAVPPVVLDEAP